MCGRCLFFWLMFSDEFRLRYWDWMIGGYDCGPDRAQRVNGSRNLTSWRQSKIDQLGFIGRRP